MTKKRLSSADLVGPVLLNGDAGTSGYVLTSGGATAFPTWSAVSGGKYPDGFVFSNANSTAATTTTSQSIFQSGARSYALTAGKTYAFELKLDLNIAFPAGSPFAVRLDPTFTQTPQSVNYHSVYIPSTTGSTYGTKVTATGVQVVTPTFSSATGGFLLIDGFFRANATTGGSVEFKFQLSVGSPGGSATMQTGSWQKILDLGVSTAPGIISGTWT